MNKIQKILRSAAPLLALGLVAQGASADDAQAQVQANGFKARGSVYVGTVYRTEGRDPELIPAPNGAAVGASTDAAGGKNQDDGDLNFGKWQPVSTTLKGLLEVGYTQGNYGAIGSAQGWYDYVLRNVDRPWGNLPNNFTPNTPLSDAGFSARTKFSNVVLDELYLFGHNRLGEHPLDWKLGQQRLDWGSKFQIRGGLNDLSPEDLPARRRAGALAEEGRIPVPAAWAQFAATPTTALSGFLQFHFEPNAVMGCGTFYSQLDFVAEGCDKVLAGKGSDRASLTAGQYIGRAPTQSPSGLQGGLGLTQQLPDIASEVGIYLTQFHSRKVYYGGFKSTRDPSMAPFIAGNADGKNPLYFTDYPDDIRMAALTFNRKLEHGAIMAEASYRPNQPYQYNAIDELQAFLSPTAPTPLRAQVNALAPGAAFQGYERHKAAQVNLGAVQNLPGILGASSGQVGIEMAYKWADLPPAANGIRFGRPDAFGQAPVAGAACPAGTPAYTCSDNGYVSRNAFGSRVRAGLSYADLFAGSTTLTPSLLYGYDVLGWSEDGAISQSRQFAVVSLKAEVRKAYQMEVTWQPLWNGTYDNLRDRSSLALSLGYRF